MDKVDNGQNDADLLKVTDDKKRRWNSFRKGKKQIKKLWKSKKTLKQADDDQSSPSEDSREYIIAYDNGNDERSVSSPISPLSTTSSVDPVPSIMLHRASLPGNSSPEYMAATTDEDEHFSSNREGQNPTGIKSRSPTRDQLSLTRQQEFDVCRVFEVLCENFVTVFNRICCSHHHPLDRQF